jgi:hypothetical protein
MSSKATTTTTTPERVGNIEIGSVVRLEDGRIGKVLAKAKNTTEDAVYIKGVPGPLPVAVLALATSEEVAQAPIEE